MACAIGRREQSCPRGGPRGMTMILRSVAAFLVLEGVLLVTPGVLSSPTKAPTAETCLGQPERSMAQACHAVAQDLAQGGDLSRAIAVEERVYALVPSDPEVAATLAKMHHTGAR